MDETKQWWRSKGLWGATVTIVVGFLLTKGWIDAEWAGAITAILGVWGFYSRGSAQTKLSLFKPPVIVLLAGLVLFAGCSRVRMSAPYAQALEQSAIVVGELNKRCQAGDDVACRKGLDEASETLYLLVDALHGVDSRGEADNGME